MAAPVRSTRIRLPLYATWTFRGVWIETMLAAIFLMQSMTISATTTTTLTFTSDGDYECDFNVGIAGILAKQCPARAGCNV